MMAGQPNPSLHAPAPEIASPLPYRLYLTRRGPANALYQSDFSTVSTEKRWPIIKRKRLLSAPCDIGTVLLFPTVIT